MLTKLFKHDMRQISKAVSPILLLIIGVSIFGSCALKINTETFLRHNGDMTIGAAAASTILYMLFGLSCLALFALVVVAYIMILGRYYKSFFTDEGYLTFTLPVKTRTLLFSKMWSSILWTLIAIAVTICGVGILAVFGTAPKGEFISREVLCGIGEVLKALFSEIEPLGVFSIIAMVVCLISELFYAIMLIFLAITIGSIVAKKHKILASIGFVYLLQLAVATISVILAVTMFSTTFSAVGTGIISIEAGTDSTHMLWAAAASFLSVYSLYYVGLTVGGFAICNKLLKSKLNLA